MKKNVIGSTDELKWKSSCSTCRHLLTPKTCEAFPNGIPVVILGGTNKHLTPYPGDNGIQYEEYGRRVDAPAK